MTKLILINSCENNIALNKFNADYTIGVERGCIDFINKNILIDISISDFDNVTLEELNKIKYNSKYVEILDKNKDLLDGEIAIQKAIEFNPEKIIFISKPTKRIDMNLSFLHLINKYNIFYLTEDACAFKIKKGNTIINFNNYQDYTYITFYPIENTKITLENFLYNVVNLDLKKNSLNAYSNSFMEGMDPKINTSEDIIVIFNK